MAPTKNISNTRIQGCVEAILLRYVVHRAPEPCVLLVGLVCISAAFVTFASASTVAAAAVSLALLSLGVCVYIICIRYVLIYVCMYVAYISIMC